MRKFIFALTCVCLVLAFGAPALSATVMRLANVAAAGDPRDVASKMFADLVEKKTNGEAKIEVFSGGTLGDWRVTIEGLKPGIVNIVIESIGTLEPYTKLAAVDPFPYLYRDLDHFKKVWYSDTGRELLKKIGDQGGFELMGPMYRGARYVTSKKKFTNVGELKGLKIRAPQLKMYLSTWEKLGASPTPMAATEIYTGLQQGTVDAQENPMDFNYSNAFYEVCPFLIKTRHVFSNDIFIFDKAYFDSLPANIQKALLEAADEVAKWRTAFSQEREDDYIAKFKEKNVEIVDVDVEPFRARVADIVELFPDLKEIVQQIHEVK